jgi:hypothetical protein
MFRLRLKLRIRLLIMLRLMIMLSLNVFYCFTRFVLVARTKYCSAFYLHYTEYCIII